MGTLHKDICTFMIMSCSILLIMRNVSDQGAVGMSNNFFPPKSYAVYMWKNMAKPEMPQMAKWCTCFALWITRATDTHWEYEKLNVFPQL